MPHPSEMFTFVRWITAVVTITSTPQTILALITPRLGDKQIDPNLVQQVIIMEKVAAGTDRLAIRLGEDASHMSLHYGAGVPADPPGRGIDFFAERVGADVPATILIGLSG